MQKIFFVFLFFIFSPAFADIDMSGTYTGCADFTASGKQQIYFHLVKVPTGFAADEFQYAVGFVMSKGPVASFFPEVKFNADKTQMLMKLDIVPRHDYGLIVKALKIRIISEQALAGEYVSNSAIAGEFASHGTWTATKVDPRQTMPVLKCN